MAARIRLSNGRDIVVLLTAKRVIEELEKTRSSDRLYARFKSSLDSPVWIHPEHVAAIEDREDDR
jgi:hypothetical protein